jgi:hypothetical protein
MLGTFSWPAPTVILSKLRSLNPSAQRVSIVQPRKQL